MSQCSGGVWRCLRAYPIGDAADEDERFFQDRQSLHLARVILHVRYVLDQQAHAFFSLLRLQLCTSVSEHIFIFDASSTLFFL